jgi:hypothetical protein
MNIGLVVLLIASLLEVYAQGLPASVCIQPGQIIAVPEAEGSIANAFVGDARDLVYTVWTCTWVIGRQDASQRTTLHNVTYDGDTSSSTLLLFGTFAMCI